MEDRSQTDPAPAGEKNHPERLAETLRKLSGEEKPGLVNSLSPDLAGEVLWLTDRSTRATVFRRITDRRLAEIMSSIPVDWAGHCLRQLSAKRLGRILPLLSAEKGARIRKQLSYRRDTAGARMDPDVTPFDENLSVAETISKIRETRSLRRIFHCYVVDGEGHLKGVVPLRKLLMADPQTRLKDLMLTSIITVPVDMDQEEVARVATRNMIFALPVVDGKGVLKGVITLDKVLRVIQDEATEDIYKMAGTDKKEIISHSIFRIARIRAPWLFASWLGGLAAAVIIGIFEDSIAKVAALAAFLPIVLGMGGNIGTQSATVVVRGLAMGYIDVKEIGKTVFKEMLIGFMLGVTYGLLLGVFAWFRFRGHIPPYGWDLGLTVGLAIFCSMSLAATMGSLIPMILSRLKIDPAIATGPFVTTSIDILGIIAYFLVATFLLSEHMV